jgi:hypothetical protein
MVPLQDLFDLRQDSIGDAANRFQGLDSIGGGSPSSKWAPSALQDDEGAHLLGGRELSKPALEFRADLLGHPHESRAYSTPSLERPEGFRGADDTVAPPIVRTDVGPYGMLRGLTQHPCYLDDWRGRPGSHQ